MELTGGLAPSRRLAARFPWAALALTCAIAALGVWNLASASRVSNVSLWKSQLAWLGGGLAVVALLALWDYRHLMALAFPLYGLVLLLLLAVMLKGRTVLGARRWLDLGPVHLQPSELAKLTVLLVLARLFHERPPPKGGYGLPQLLLPFALILAPAAMVMKQPDLGTALIIAAVGFTLCVFARIRTATLVVLLLVGAVGSGLAWQRFLKGYQKRRIESFLNPEGDALGAGYHANQSMIAVGSGQLTGKGWGKGTQTQLSFLPEQHTDFIFSVWAEEHGFVMSVLLLLLYFGLFVWALWVAGQARERFGSYLAAGVAALIFWHVFINIGMVTGVLPVVGVTLPLMSYGGSSLLTILIGIGIVLNVQMRRQLF
ncbi:MAG TPA: rod shape-determining protein RodA [Myxococcales bacterium]|nr:rod shape-determining protein RodA [Myxococcales bacterium]